MSVSIQQENFDHGQEYQHLCQDAPAIGAIVTFCGLVREFDNGEGYGLELEYYPGMTEKTLHNIIERAKQHWPILNARIVHRVGKLHKGEQIVFVGVNSQHRDAAFQACEFIMDFLKTEAPFWKKALNHQQDYWVEAKDKDQQAKTRWQTKP